MTNKIRHIYLSNLVDKNLKKIDFTTEWDNCLKKKIGRFIFICKTFFQYVRRWKMSMDINESVGKTNRHKKETGAILMV